MNEQKNLIRWTLSFLNWRIYKWDIVPINGEFRWIIELSDGTYYPVFFIFFKWECVDFNLIENEDLSAMLKRWYKQVFWINNNKNFFDKEKISRVFDFNEYKKNWSNDIHIAIQHRIWNYDWDNIWFMPEWNWTLTYGNWDFYEWDFKNWVPCWRWKLIFNKHWIMEWEFKDWMLNWEWKSLYPNRWEYEWGFKNWKPGWKWKILYNNWDSYEWEFIAWVPDWKWKLIHMTWEVIEWKFKWWKISK